MAAKRVKLEIEFLLPDGSSLGELFLRLGVRIKQAAQENVQVDIGDDVFLKDFKGDLTIRNLSIADV